jgi:glycosyltransferase involved in cell wall biosynthesis
VTGRRRVLYLSGWPIGTGGEGAASFIHDQIVELSSVVDAVFVEHAFASIARLALQPRGVLFPERIHGGWPDSVRALRVSTIRLPTRITQRTLLEDVRSAGRAVAQSLRRAGERVDAIHAHVVLPAGLLGLYTAANLRVPLVLQEHSGPFDMHLDTAEKREAVREILAGAAQIVAVGEPLARQLRATAPIAERVIVRPNLVRTDIFQPTPLPAPISELRLITIGSLVSVKDHRTLIDCLRILRRRGMPAQLTIVGDGPLRTSLEQQVLELGLASAVIFRGHLTRVQTAQAIADSHIYVCSSRVETFGLAVAEAISCGRPVVTTRCGGPEALVESEFCASCAVGDADDMALSVGQVVKILPLVEPTLLHDLMNSRFGPAAFRERMLEVYSRVLDSAEGKSSVDRASSFS